MLQRFWLADLPAARAATTEMARAEGQERSDGPEKSAEPTSGGVAT
jgi:hypothetical protein